MKLRQLALAILSIGAISAAQAAQVTNDYGAYSVTFDDSLIGGPSFNFSSSGNQVGFGWNLNSSFSVVNGAQIFAFPEFTITANAGYTLSGLSAFVGNFVYTSVGGASISATAGGTYSVNGGADVLFGGALTKTSTSSGPGFDIGYLSGTATTAIGTFSTLSILGGMNFSATGGTFASIVGQPQNELKFTFTAVPVPEPETYAMLLAGLAVVGSMAKRRRPV